MFILAPTCAKPQEETDRLMKPHMAWVEQGYDAGLFLASGRKAPRIGGVIPAKSGRSAIEAFVTADPITVHGVADDRNTEAAVMQTADGLSG